MDTDSENEVINPTYHKLAYNVFFRNNRPENIKGSRNISYTKPTGTNEVIGGFYDEFKSRIFWFMWNSAGNHSIWMYTIKSNTVQSLIVENTNAASGVLNFDRNYPIYAAKILTGDTVQGDELWFINSQKQPCKFSIDRAISGSYGTIQRSYLSVNFAPPIMPPYCCYENDNTVTVNNLRKRLFKFKLRFTNTALNKSVTSIQSELPLPVNYQDSDTDKDPTKNCRIAIVYPTGNSEVKKIELLASQNEGNGWGDYVLIKEIDKATDGIANDDIAILRFYNNEAYVPIDVKESLQLFDMVPLQANDIELLNGNVPIYCGITEYYNPVTVTGTMTSSSVPQRTTQYPFVLRASQSGDSGFGTGNIHIVLVGTIAVGNQFSVNTTGSSLSFTATAATTSDVITGLSTAATSAGFTVISSDSENLVIIKAGESLLRFAASATIAVTNSFVFDWNSRYAFSVQYMDENYVTIGSQRSANWTLQTVNYTETTGTPNIPKLTLEITSRPPVEAKYFTIGRSKNLTKLKHFYWVCARTFKDSEYAYIDIENLNNFIKKNPSASYRAYQHAADDRIRFVKKLSGTAQIYTDNDFQIVSQEINPTVNGIEYTGQFLKILLPTTSGTFDFGSSDFYNYYIQIYTPALSTSEGYNSYYEFGERYTIGDAGLSTRYHQGGTQNQTSNLSQPAIFEITQGDDYYRSKDINTGGEIAYEISAGTISAGRHTLGVSYVSQTFTDSFITTGNSPLQDLSGWTYASNSRAILKTGAGSPTYTFRAKGSIVINAADDDTFAFFFQDKYGNIRYCSAIRGLAVGIQTIPIDCTFQLDSSNHISLLGWSESDYTNSRSYSVTDLVISLDKIYTTPVIDKNFSDFFASAVNSNGRSFIVDKNKRQATYENLFRWGLSRTFDTNLNQTNRFYEQNATEADLDKGAILRMVARERQLRFFQERGVGVLGVYNKFLKDNSGANIITSTDEIITKNNFNYYSGRYGLGGQPTSLVSSKSRDFFVDPIRGYHCMVGESGGIVPISELYNGQYLIQPLFTTYNKDYLRPNGTKSKILGYYDFSEEMYVTILQGGTLAGNPDIASYTFGFIDNDKQKGYSSFFNFYGEWMICAEDKIYGWLNGDFHVFDDDANYGNFFGTQYKSSVKVAFNKEVLLKKKYLTSQYNSNKIWTSDRYAIDTDLADSIKTSSFNLDTGFQQISELKLVDYSIQEGKRTAAFLRDKNSGLVPINAVLDGDFLEGNWIEIDYIYTGNEYAWIFAPQVTWIESNREF